MYGNSECYLYKKEPRQVKTVFYDGKEKKNFPLNKTKVIKVGLKMQDRITSQIEQKKTSNNCVINEIHRLLFLYWSS